MRSCSAFLLSALLLFGVACDSGDSVSRLDVGGTYTVSTWTFKPTAAVLPQEDVKARLDQGVTQVTLASGRESYSFTFGFPGANGVETYIIAGGYDTEGDNRVVLDFGEKNRDRRRLLLPQKVRFTFDEATGVLSFDGTISGVNLEDYDPAKYGGSGLTDVNGRLNVVLTRR